MNNNEKEDKTNLTEYIQYLLEHKVFLMSAIYITNHDAEFTFVSFDEDVVETKRTYYVKEDDIVPFVFHLYEIALIDIPEDEEIDISIDEVEKTLLGRSIPIRLLNVPPKFYNEHTDDILLTIKKEELIRKQLVKILSKDKVSLVDADVFVDSGKNIVCFIFKDMDEQLSQINIVDEEEKASEFLYYLYKFVFMDQPKTAQLDDIVKDLKGKWLPKNIIYADENTKKLILREKLL